MSEGNASASGAHLYKYKILRRAGAFFIGVMQPWPKASNCAFSATRPANIDHALSNVQR